jgi:hypothetical protein
MPYKYNYLPIPPRVWSRVQNSCTYTDASGNSDINYNQVYIPLIKQTVTQARANYEDKMIYKGNVLQYKGNSSRLTKSQKYTQLAKGFGPNRTKVFATQSQTYTNPNTTGLQRVNTQTYPYPNGVVGEPNNPSGPFQYNVMNPNDCSNNSIQDGGTLVCGTFANPCTGEIIKQGATSSIIINPASASDVPGSSVLFWDTQVQTWFPKPRYVMNNSTDKWPVNYKGLDGISGLVSATRPSKPYLMLIDSSCNSVTLSWTDVSSNCIPISSYNIYQNGILVQTLRYTTTLTTINGLVPGITYSFFITSVSNTTESIPSNIVTVVGLIPCNITSLVNTSYTVYSNNGYTGIVFDNNNNTTFTTGTAVINFCKNVNNASILIVGGGGGAGSGDTEKDQLYPAGGAGGSGGAITYLTGQTISGSTNINLTIGFGGEGNKAANAGQGLTGGQDGTASLFSTISSGGGGKGSGIGGGGSAPAGSSNSSSGGGGGGGGGAYRLAGLSPTPGVTNGGLGGSGLSGVNPGVNGSNSQYGVDLNGGSGGASNSLFTTVTLPFIPVTLNLGGGGGGGGSVSGGGAGNGTGGVAGTNTLGSYSGDDALYGIANSAYGGGGGGGGIQNYTAGNTNIGGNGGNGTVIIWWPTF